MSRQKRYNSAVDGNIKFKLGGNYRRGGRRVWHTFQVLDFKKFEINGLSAVRGECASSCQMSSKWSNGCRDMTITVFRMAAVRYLGFVKFKFFKDERC